MYFETRANRGRSAFTLIELLIVIAIIAILAGLGAWGVFAMIGTQQRRNTETTIRVVNKLLQDRWTTVIAEARKEAPSPAVVNLAGADPTGERAKVIWIKVRLAEAFPVGYAEVSATNTTSIVNAYIPANRRKPHFAKYQQLIGSVQPGGAGESSACLLMAVKALTPGGVAIDDQLKFAVKDTDGDTLAELVDGWGTPLAFFRFPWNNAALQAANPGIASVRGAKYADPVDTGGALINAAWYALPARGIFETDFKHQVKTSAGNAYYVVPVIVSAGPNLVMDVGGDLLPGPKAADNMFSFELRGD